MQTVERAFTSSLASPDDKQFFSFQIFYLNSVVEFELVQASREYFAEFFPLYLRGI